MRIDREVFRLDNDTRTDWRATDPRTRRFQLYKDSNLVVELTYHVGKRLPADLTPFVEDEDFDFGLFIHNVVSDPARQRLAFSGADVPATTTAPNPSSPLG